MSFFSPSIHPQKQSSRSAFTLFELMIVIIIIGIIYGVFVQNIGVLEEEKKGFKFENLKEFLIRYQKDNTVSIICLEEDLKGCSDCRIYFDGKPTESKINLKPEITVWYLDPQDILEKKDYGTIIHNNDYVKKCFEYSLYPNGSSSEMIVEYQNKTYLFFPYFQPTQIFNDPNDARLHLLDLRDKIKG